MAEEAVHLIYQHLKAAYDDGRNKEARSGMLKAAYCAGVAFTKSYVGYIHAVAHSLGGQYGTPHGLANAVILPIVLNMYGPACRKKLAALARNAGVVDREMEDQEAVGLFYRLDPEDERLHGDSPSSSGDSGRGYSCYGWSCG